MSAIKEFLVARAMRDNPAFAQQQMYNSEINREEELARRAAEQVGIYGNLEQQTGMYNKNIPIQDRFLMLQQKMLGSANPLLQKQQSTNLTRLQDSLISNQGAMQRHVTPSGDYKPPKPTITSVGVEGQPGLKQQAIVNPDGSIVPVGSPYKSGGSQNVYISAGEKEYDKALGKGFAGSVLDMNKGLRKASRMATAAEDISKTINNNDMYTGIGGGAAQIARKIGSALGLDIGKNVAEGEYVGKMQQQLALAMRAPSEDGGLSGSTSDRDLAFLLDSVPGLTTTPEGLKLLAEVYRNDATIRKEKLAFITKHGRLTPEVSSAMYDAFKDRSALTDTVKERIKRINQKVSKVVPPPPPSTSIENDPRVTKSPDGRYYRRVGGVNYYFTGKYNDKGEPLFEEEQ